MVQGKIHQIILSSALMLFCVVSCSNDEKIIETQVSSEACDSTLVYADIQPLITANCNDAGCHAANSGSRALVTYEDLERYINGGQIQNRVLGPNADMPLGREWDDLKNKEKLKCWIDNGFTEE